MKKKQELTFEQGLAKLEEIADSMEDATLPLDNLMSKYEEGIKLSSMLESQLKLAKARLNELTLSNSGEIVATPFETHEEEI